MKYSIIIHDLHIIEVFDDATEMIDRILHYIADGKYKPTHLGIWEGVFTIILDVE